MTPAERLLLITLADTLLVVLRRLGSSVPVEQLRAARHAVDDEAFRVASGDAGVTGEPDRVSGEGLLELD